MGRKPPHARLVLVAHQSRDAHDQPLQGDDLLTPATAAAIANRSVRTIRRAYSRGRLDAYRDGSGRGVRIRYADLRRWMMSEQIAATELARGDSGQPLSLIGVAPSRYSASLSENLALLTAAREARAKRGRAGGAEHRAGARAVSARA